MGQLAQKLTDKIANLQVEIERIQTVADKNIAEIRGQIVVLTKAQKALTAENETLLEQLRGLGML